MAEHSLDCKGLNCPMPIVKISRAMKGLALGDRLVVEASDPSFGADVEAWAKRMGHDLVELSSSPALQRAVLEKKTA